MIPFAEEFERSALKFKEHISVNSQQLTGKIRIGTPDGLGNCYLASELKALQEKNPLLEVELVSVPIYYSLSKREVDILITVTRPTAKRIMVEKIISYKFGLFASIEYLKSTPAIQDVADLNEHRLIGYIDDLLYDQRLRFLEEIFPAARTVFRSSTVLGQMSAIKAGAGIGVLPFFMIQTESDLVRILPDKYVEREFWIQVNPDSSKLTRVKETIDFILNIMRGDDKIFNSL
ncbi:LysR substrate-binding domain-containing protein [Maridesulfovibrio sp.]|uniref:LysR substrate-binding domain-containing protein n=1 Tax=Maridesulfovibrio sp. TaxID=2795000 RepID=UPI002A186BBC|nr:LysR substrate-binding domain-containing protein [Maridesulfovibrio sp.]